VALVPVAELKVKPWREEAPEAVRVESVVAPVTERAPPSERFVPVAPVKRRLSAKRLVEVVFVPVAFVQVMFVGVKFDTDRLVSVAFVARRFVMLPFVAKRFVVVTEVPVAEVKVVP
jgi:hypothetical protein